MCVSTSAQLTSADIPLNSPPNIRRLIEVLLHDDKGKSYASTKITALKEIGASQQAAYVAIPFVERLCKHSDARVRSEALATLATIGGPGVTALKTIAESGNLDAISALIESDSDEGYTATLELLTQAKSARVRAAALNCLGGHLDSRAVDPLIHALEDSDSNVRLFAASAFRFLRDKKAVVPLLSLLGGNERDNAIRALGWQQDERAIPPLLRILNSRTTDHTRNEAAQALGMMANEQILHELYRMLDDVRQPALVRAGAARGLGAVRASDIHSTHEEEILSKLLRCLTSNREPLIVRVEAARGLGDFGSEKASGPLLQMTTSHEDEELRFWSAMSAAKLQEGQISEVSAVHALQNYRLMSDGDEVQIPGREKALEDIAKHGSTLIVRIAAGSNEWKMIALGGFLTGSLVVVIFLYLWHRSRSAKHLEVITNG